LQVGWQARLPAGTEFPVRAVFSHRCGCLSGIHIEFCSTWITLFPRARRFSPKLPLGNFLRAGAARACC